MAFKKHVNLCLVNVLSFNREPEEVVQKRKFIMQKMDYVVLVGYFAAMIFIGLLCARKIKKQEDYFMGGRGFGKLLQTFAAFGAGTGAQDPINVGGRTWTSGLSGIWSALLWLFVTPFYWIFAVWYRRMRHITLGDWFVERYESRGMGVAYTAFGFVFYIFYLSTMFSAISKVAEPLLGDQTVQTIIGWFGSSDPDHLKFVLVPVIALVVIAYGVVGGLAAAYWTDLIQGLCIIVLSLILIPYGLWGLVEKFGNPEVMTTVDGFTILHERLTPENFQLFGGPRAGEFPPLFIVSLTLLGLVGIVVQPHFIATGGGTAKNENSARIGLVTGNFLKRLCTIGWALTALIVLALLADSVEIARDPDRAWGVASREILSQVTVGGTYLGLVGLMLACLLAALMSSADCYMLVTSALLVNNIYAPYVNPNASEQTYIKAGRIAGLLIIVGAATVSLIYYNVYKQFQLALEIAIVFAAPFWIGMFWRRATRLAAGLTIAFSLTLFFVVPLLAPKLIPGLQDSPRFAITNDIVTTEITRTASPADVAQRTAKIAVWEDTEKKVIPDLQNALAEYEQAHQTAWESAQDSANYAMEDIPAPYELSKLDAALSKLVAAKEAVNQFGPRLEPIEVSDSFTDIFTMGGEPIFWERIRPREEQKIVEVDRQSSEDGQSVTIVQQYEQDSMQGEGRFKIDFLFYQMVGMDLTKADKAMLQTLRLPPRLITPFLVMILLSLVTKRGSKEALDRYYVKMKTPVDSDPEEDRQQLEQSYADPSRFDNKKLFPNSSLEIQKPTTADVVGFLVSVGICFAFLALASWLAQIGS